MDRETAHERNHPVPHRLMTPGGRGLRVVERVALEELEGAVLHTAGAIDRLHRGARAMRERRLGQPARLLVDHHELDRLAHGARDHGAGGKAPMSTSMA